MTPFEALQFSLWLAREGYPTESRMLALHALEVAEGHASQWRMVAIAMRFGWSWQQHVGCWAPVKESHARYYETYRLKFRNVGEQRFTLGPDLTMKLDERFKPREMR